MGAMKREEIGEPDTVITVIIPTFRRPDQLLRALCSALADDIDGLEVIVVDDAPEQSARAVVDGVNDARVRYEAMPTVTGGRPAHVRNHAIGLTRGELLYFLDDDDTVCEGALRSIVETFAANPDAGVVFGRVLCDGPNRVVRERYQRWFDWAATTAGRIERSRRLTVGVILFRGTVIINSCCAVRREVAVAVGGYDPAIDVYEDVDFFLRAIRHSGHVFINRPVLLYRTGEQSIIHDLDGDVTSIGTSYEIIRRKYRAAHGRMEYLALHVMCKLLPVGAPVN